MSEATPGSADARDSFEDARGALDRGDLDLAIELFQRYLDRRPEDPNALFNLGLAYKLRRAWGDSAHAFRRAADIEPTMEEAWWNYGVAATALRDWSSAREAWRAIGVEPGAGDGPPTSKLGPSPIRLGGGEVVWAERVDPCRAVIVNVPLPESGHRWRDVVLHDVVPRGERAAWGRTWAVFDEIARMEEGPYPTLECAIEARSADDREALDSLFSEHDFGAEDWTSNVRWLCESCSLGSPHEHSVDGATMPIWVASRRYGFAGPEDEILHRLNDWGASAPGRSFGELRPAQSD